MRRLYVHGMLMADRDFVNSVKTSGPRTPAVNPDAGGPKLASAMSWRQQTQRLQREAHVFYFAFNHPGVRWYARLVAVCTAAYLLSPIQLIPSFIPVVGFLDDVLILFLGAKLLQRIIAPDVLTECRELAEAAETRRKEEIRSGGAAVGFVAIVSLWILSAVIATMLVMKYIAG